MSELLTLLALIVLVLLVFGVSLFGLAAVEQVALGLALFTAAHLAWVTRGTP